MINNMEQFGTELYLVQDGFSKKPSLTYETYNAALKRHLMKFKNEINNIEKKLMKQGIKVFFFRIVRCTCFHNVLVNHTIF